MRYFCSWDEKKTLKADKYCDEMRYPVWFDSPDECDCDDEDAGGEDGPFCMSVGCYTDPPTGMPTSSVGPTHTPTASALPSLAPTTTGPTTTTPTTALPTTPSADAGAAAEVRPLPSGGFSFNAPVDAAAAATTRSVPLSPFVVDFHLAGDEVDARRRRSLRGEEEDAPYSSSPAARDVELLSIVSDHLLERFGIGLSVEVAGVELIVLDKREWEEEDGDGSDIVSYEYAGNALYGTETPVPSSAVLDAEVLKAFNNPPGKAACMDALHSSVDDVISAMTDVGASTREGFGGGGVEEGGGGGESEGPSPDASAAEEEEEEVVVTSPTIDDGDGGVTKTASLVFASLLATAFVVAGLLAVRKYRRYHRNNASNDYVNYQNRKRSGSGAAAVSPTTKVSVDGRVLRFKRYFNFESPKDGRSVAGAGEEGGGEHDPTMYDDLEIVGGDTFPASQDQFTDDEDTAVIPPGKNFDRQGRQFEPSDVDVSLPYDEGGTPSTTIGEGSTHGATTHDMIYFSHIANQMTEDQLDGSRSHATVDDLYSDKDSYFHSYIGGGGPDKDSIQSTHSLDTLDNTFGFVNESISHLIDGIEDMLEKRDMEEKNAAPSADGGVGSRNIDSLDIVSPRMVPMIDTSMSTTATDQWSRHIGDVVVDEKVGYSELPVLGATPRGYEEVLKTRFSQATNDSRGIAPPSFHRSGDGVERDSDEAFELLQDTPTFDSSDVIYGSSDVVYETAANTSDISTTDELFARIAELESKILNTESQLAQEESINRTPLITNSKARTTGTRNGAVVSSSALQLDFTETTLAMIEQRRLECTPPPSESEVDSAMIQEARDQRLLGRYLDETDSEEESTIFLLPGESFED